MYAGRKRKSKRSIKLIPSEMLAIYLSRQLKDKEFGYVGTGSLVGMAACMIAQNIHAPDLSWIAGESGYINPSPPLVKSISGFHPNTEATKSLNAIIRYQAGGLDFYFVEVRQVDENARINQTMPGLKCQVGTASTPFLRRAKRVYFFTTDHSPNSLCKKVDFVSGWRKWADTKMDTILATPKAIFHWFSDPETHFVQTPILTKIFDEEDTEDSIREITGFNFSVSEHLSYVSKPNAVEIDALREEVDIKHYLRDLPTLEKILKEEIQFRKTE